MDKDRAQVNEAFGGLGEKLKGSQEEELKALMDKVAFKGFLPKELLGLSEVMVEGIYGQAYRLYNTGRYQEAIELFRLLTLINVQESKYLMGLAACFHMLKEYPKAIEMYTMCSLVDGENPVPYYHLCDCYIQIEDKGSALIALEMAVKRASKPMYQVLKDRCLLTIESLKKELFKQAEK